MEKLLLNYNPGTVLVFFAIFLALAILSAYLLSKERQTFFGNLACTLGLFITAFIVGLQLGVYRYNVLKEERAAWAMALTSGVLLLAYSITMLVLLSRRALREKSSYVAYTKGQVKLLRSYLMGSVTASMLFGTCFFFIGIGYYMVVKNPHSGLLFDLLALVLMFGMPAIINSQFAKWTERFLNQDERKKQIAAVQGETEVEEDLLIIKPKN